MAFWKQDKAVRLKKAQRSQSCGDKHAVVFDGAYRMSEMRASLVFSFTNIDSNQIEIAARTFAPAVRTRMVSIQLHDVHGLTRFLMSCPGQNLIGGTVVFTSIRIDFPCRRSFHLIPLAIHVSL